MKNTILRNILLVSISVAAIFAFAIVLRSAPPNTPYIDAADDAQNAASSSGFQLTSSAVGEGGQFPKAFTCDGTSISPPIAWAKEPAGTKSFAVIMQHIAGPGDLHWYWVVHHIPAAVHAIAAGDKSIGIYGGNSTGPDAAYAPPCSKGPGPKRYSITVYALSAEPGLEKPVVNRAELLDAIKGITLDHARLNFIYAR
jgi:phosphatidylethanolamine-binding protein (PEBP) family uncharacterized protein